MSYGGSNSGSFNKFFFDGFKLSLHLNKVNNLQVGSSSFILEPSIRKLFSVLFLSALRAESILTHSQGTSQLSAILLLLLFWASVVQAATVTWKATSNGSWETASNWDPEAPPQPGDDVIVSTPAVTITCNSPVNLHSLTVIGGTVVFLDTAIIDTVSLGVGEADFRAVAVLKDVELVGTSCRLGANSTAAEVNITNSLKWQGTNCGLGNSGGNGQINLLSSCRSTINGTGIRQLLQTLVTNYGQVDYFPTGYGMYYTTGGSWINAPGSFFNATQPATGELSISGDASSYTFTNQGTINVYHSLSVQVQFNNHGTVNVLQGTLDMHDGGTHKGEFNHCDGCFLKFQGKTQILEEESKVSAGGNVIFSATSTTVSGTFEAQYFSTLGAGTTTFTKFYTTNDTVAMFGGKLDFKGSAVIANLLLSASSSSDFVADSPNAEVNITNSFRWEGQSCIVGKVNTGRINLLSSCRTTIRGSGNQQHLRTIVTNYGQTDYFPYDNGMIIYTGGSWINAAGSVFNAEHSIIDLVLSGSAPQAFTNYGTVIVNVKKTFTMNIPFYNHGTVNVVQGTLAMGSGGTHTGEFNHSSGCVINFSGGTHVLAEESTVTAGGTIIFSAPSPQSITVSGIFEAQSLQQTGSGTTKFTNFYTSNDTVVISGGTLDFPGSAVLANVELYGSLSRFRNTNSEVNITNSFKWKGSNCQVGNGNGQLNLLSSCRTTISGTGNQQYLSTVVTNYGQTDYFPNDKGIQIITGGSWTNAAGSVFNATHPIIDLLLKGGGPQTFTNYGTVSVHVNKTFTMDIPFYNHGTVNVVQGTLAMGDGRTHTGEFNHCDGCFINFSGGTHILTEESFVTYGRGIIFAATSTTVSGTFEPQYFQQTGGPSLGITTFTNFYTSNDTIVISGGKLDFTGSAVLANVELSGTLSTLSGLLNSNSEVNITNSFKWQGSSTVGNGNGRLNLLSSCRSTISGAGTQQYLRTTLTNYGQTDYFPTGSIYIYIGGTWINAPGAVFNVSSTNGSVALTGYSSPFVNQGSMRISVPASEIFDMNSLFDNKGHVEVLSGTFSMNWIGEHSGIFTHNPASFIRFGGYTQSLTSTSVVNAGNGIEFIAVNVTIQGKFLPETFHLSGVYDGSVTFDNGADSLSFYSISQSGGTLTFQPSINSVHITEFAPTGGITNFKTYASIYTLALNQSTIQFRANGCINSLSMYNTALLQISSSTTLNIFNSFNWDGEPSDDARINSLNDDVGGVINLLQDCTAVFSSASSSNYIDHVQINNHGTIHYRPTGEGVILRNGAKIINQPTGNFSVEASTFDPTIGVTGTIHFENHGLVDVNVDEPYEFKMNPVFTNYGTLRLRNSRMATSEFLQQAGITMVESGALTASSNFTVQGGIVTGEGAIETNNVQHYGGTIRPGKSSNSTGTLHISGQYTKGSDSNLEIEATSVDAFDVLSVTGTATLDGQFTFIPIDFVPSVGNTFEVLKAQSVAGTFASTASPDITISYQYGASTIVSVQSIVPAFTCSGGCGHGYCVEENTCSCEEGYTGSDCTQFSCQRIGGCAHGQCTAPGACTCDEYLFPFHFFSTQNLEIHKISKFCLHLLSGWIGLICNEPELSCNSNSSTVFCKFSENFPVKCSNYEQCMSPPPNECIGNVAVRYSAPGNCTQEGECIYTPLQTDCDALGGVCQFAECVLPATTGAVTTSTVITTASTDTTTTASDTTTSADTTTTSPDTTTASADTSTSTLTTTASSDTTSPDTTTSTVITTTSPATTTTSQVSTTASTDNITTTDSGEATGSKSVTQGSETGRSIVDAFLQGDVVTVVLAGIVVALVLALCVVSVACIVTRRRRRKKRESAELPGDSDTDIPLQDYAEIPSEQYKPIGSLNKLTENSNSVKNYEEIPSAKYQPIQLADQKSKRQAKALSVSPEDLRNEQSFEIPYSELVTREKIGAGAFGEVFAGEWRRTKVAIKVLNNNFSKEQQESFVSEISIMKNLRPHANVTTFFKDLFDFQKVLLLLGVCVEPLCLVTPLCAKGSLFSLLHSNKKIPPETLVKIIKGIAAGMYHLHTEKVVHRDLAARNVLLGKDYEPKISDFGLSRMMQSQDAQKTTSIVGPLKHMAPECLLHREYSSKSDVWAFAIVLIEIYTRDEPYPTLSPVEVASQVSQKVDPLIPDAPENMSAEMKHIFYKCINTEPDKRPSFAEICEQFAKLPSFVL